MGKGNSITIEVEIDEQGKASAALKSLEGDVLRFTQGVNRAGNEGLRLGDIFAGNLLAAYFQRGTEAAIQFGVVAVRAAAEASDANRQLEFSATSAGLSYTRAAALAEDFGRRVGASNTEAARTFSDIVRLAERAGKVSEVDTLSRQFADLAAVRGIKGAELQSLIGTILSGQDEGLNRLGADDPSKLNAAYAASIGKTADALTQQEKAAAAVVAVQKLANEAYGESDKRLKTTAGQLDAAAASYENLTTQMGEAITNSAEFKGILILTSEALGSLVTSHEEARRELAKGLKTPEQLADEARQGTGRRVLNFLTGSAALQSSLETGILSGLLGSQDLLRASAEFARIGTNPGQAQRDEDVKRFREIKRDIDAQEAAAAVRRAASDAKTAAAAQRSALQQKLSEGLEAASKEENLNARLAKLQELQKQLKELPGMLDASEAEKQSKKIGEAIEETTKRIIAAVRTARDAMRDLLGDAQAQSDKDNPFTSIFIRAQTEAEKTRQQFLIFGEDFANVMAKIKKTSVEAEIPVLRLQSSIQSLKYEQEARRLDRPFAGLTGPEERALDVLGARAAKAVHAPQLLAEAQALLSGRALDSRGALDILAKQAELRERLRFEQDGSKREELQRQIAEQEKALSSPATDRRGLQLLFEQLRNLEALRTSGGGRLGDAARDALNTQILQLTGQVDPRVLASDPRFSGVRDLRARSLSESAGKFERDLRDSIAREEAGNQIQQDARELLSAIKGSNAPDAQKLKEFLAVTGSLSEKELTPDLRLARAEQLRAAARQEGQKEKDGEERARRLDEFVKKFDRMLSDKGVKVDAPPSNVTLNVGDGLSVDRSLLGGAPGSEGGGF